MGQNIIWEAEYNSALSNNAYSVIPSKLGGYLVGGSIATTTDGLDILILRVDSIGDTLWTKQLGGISDDEAFCVIEDANNDILVSGYTKSYGNGLSDFFITKLNATGVVQWTQTSGGVLKDGSYSIIATLDGGYLTAGYTNSSGAGLKDFYLFKLSATGTFQWAKTYGGSGNDVACDVLQNQDSSIIIVGNTTSFGSSDLNPYIIKTNKNGDTLWTKVIYETGIDIINSVSLVGKTGILLAGNKSITNRLNAQLIKLTATGHVIWQQEYDITGDDEIKDCYQNENGAVYLVGSNSTPEGTSPLCIMTNDYGDLLTNKVFSEYQGVFNGVYVDADNNIAMAGTKVNTIANLAWLVVAYNCPWYPKNLWNMDCWAFNSSNSGANKNACLFLDGNGANPAAAVKTENFIEYCRAMRIRTVVLGHLEDIIREDNQWNNNGTMTDFSNYTAYNKCTACTLNFNIAGADLRVQLANLVNELHKTGVTYVLAQWLDQTPEVYKPCDNLCSITYTADEDAATTTNNDEIFTAFIDWNNLQTGGYKFDGIMLDYEWFAPYYGAGAPGDPNKDAAKGADLWKTLASRCTLARANNDVELAAIYHNNMLYTDEHSKTNNYFDRNLDLKTDSIDSRIHIDTIDAYRFNYISLNFSNNDDMCKDNTKANNRPDCFLLGVIDQITQNETDQQRDRRRLQYLGHDINNIRTRIVPYLRTVNVPLDLGNNSQYDCLNGNNAIKASLGNLLIEICNYNGTCQTGGDATNFGSTYVSLPTVANEFLTQYFGLQGIYYNSQFPWPFSDYYLQYNNVGIAGFDFFAYRTEGNTDQRVLRHDALLDANHNPLTNGRLFDRSPILWCVEDPQKIMAPSVTQYDINAVNGRDKNEQAILQLNSMQENNNIDISNISGEQISISQVEIYNHLGQNVTNQFQLKQLDNSLLRIVCDNDLIGHFIIRLANSNRNIPFTIIK